ncbi:hypothetical protein Tco_0938918 [Tanacetum coccineum]|uniref:Uncharacterized protein n=1 Tax=Tanacetum coccineum TaxID=301880 RepID=A0ABQ5DJI5_9ASTR
MKCPLAEAFTKTSSVLYQNFLKEFWCTAIAYDPSPPSDDSMARPLKEYLIKFSVITCKNPLAFSFKTFCTSIGLDYNKGNYVAHPSPEVVKAEMAKIVLGGNYSSTKQINSIQQMIAYYLITRIKVDIGEIIYSDLALNTLRMKNFRSLPSILSNSNFSKDPSKVTGIKLTASMIVVNNLETLVSPLLFTRKKKKGKSQTVSKPKPKAQGPEALGSLPQNRKKVLTKKTTPEATKTPPTKEVPAKDSDKTHEGTRKSQLLPEGKTTDTKDSEGNDQPTSKGLPSTASKDVIADAEHDVGQTQSTGFKVLIPNQNKGKTSFEVESDTQTLLLTTTADVQALLLSEDELIKESEDDVFEAGDEMDEDTQQHEEAAASFANLKSEIERFHDDAYKVHKGNEAAFNSFEKLFTKLREQANKDVEKIFSSLKEIRDAVKEDHVQNKKVIEATKAYTKNLVNLTKLLSLVKNFNLLGLKSSVETLYAVAAIQSDVTSLKKDTSDIKTMIIEIFYAFKGQTPSSSIVIMTTLAIIEADMDTEETVVKEPIKEPKAKKESASASQLIQITIIRPMAPKAGRGKGKVTIDTDKPIRKLVPASRKVHHDPDVLILVPYEINRKMYHLTKEKIQAHLDKEEMIKKATEEAKLLDMSKPELIKMDHKQQTEAKTIADVKIHPNTKPVAMTIFKGIDKRNFDVHNPFNFGDFGVTEWDELRETIPKKKNNVVKDPMNSLSKRYERLMATPNDLGIQSALPTPLPAQGSFQLSGRKRKKMELEPEIRILDLECNMSLSEGVPFVNNMVIEEREYEMFFIDVFSDEAFQRISDVNKVGVETLLTYLVMALNITTLENTRFCLKLRKLISYHPDQEKL